MQTQNHLAVRSPAFRRDMCAFTVTELVIVVLVIAAGSALWISWRARAREERGRQRCCSNLNQLAKGMATYMNEFGDNRYYPCPLGRGARPGTYNGAEWLAALYWTGGMPDAGLFICPISGDTNRDGLNLGERRAAPEFGSQTVSYAAMHYGSNTAGPGAIRDDYPPNKVMASDDTQGGMNHEGWGANVLFFDSHIDFRTLDELGGSHTVGRRGDLFGALSN